MMAIEKRSARSPEAAQKHNAKKRAQYRDDVEYRENYKAQQRAYYHKNRETVRERYGAAYAGGIWKRRRDRHAETKRECIAFMGGKCSRCGFAGHHASFEFHHIDPATKLYRITMKLGAGWSLERLRPELEKCQLLCANCHAEVEYEKKNSVRQQNNNKGVRQ